MQRVIVDGWSSAEAAAAFGVDERRVAGWVAVFRRRGMASLREMPRRSVTGQVVGLGPCGPFERIRRKMAAIWGRLFPGVAASPPAAGFDRHKSRRR